MWFDFKTRSTNIQRRSLWREALAIVSMASASLLACGSCQNTRTPSYYVDAIRRTDANDVAARKVYSDHLVQIGPSAIPTVINAINQGSPWSRRTSTLINVLARLGKPAQKQLLLAIDQETNPQRKIYQVYSLQEAFNDFSRVNIWLKEMKWVPDSDIYFRRQVSLYLKEEVPSFWATYKKDKLNPVFLKWYKQKSRSGRPLPVWDIAVRP